MGQLHFFILFFLVLGLGQKFCTLVESERNVKAIERKKQAYRM